MAPLFRGLPDDRCQCSHWAGVRGKGSFEAGLGPEGERNIRLEAEL